MTIENAAVNAAPTEDELRAHLRFEEGGTTYPFQVDESDYVTGYGHQDKVTFARAVNHYDIHICGLDPENIDLDASGVEHQWVLFNPSENVLIVAVDEGTPGAHPITTCWGSR